MITIKKNEIYTVVIDDLGHIGEGIAHLQQLTLFIPNGLIGEKVRVKILKIKEKQGIAFGKIVEMISSSSYRIEPKCDLKQCGGCDLHHMQYQEQLRFKQKVVVENMKRIGGIEPEVLPTLATLAQFHYRNKSAIPIRAVNGEIKAGYFAKRSHTIVPFEHCLIHPKINDQIKEVVIAWMNRFHIPAYNEVTHRGKITHLLLRHTLDAVMVVLITRSKKINYLKHLVNQLTTTFPQIQSVILNVNREHGNVICGKENHLLYGTETLVASIGTLKFHIGVDTFFQINTEQIVPLYQTAVDFADLKGDELIIDAYCGVGTISLYMAQYAQKVIGIESHVASIESANRNKILNHLEQSEFLVGDAEKIMPQLYQKGVKPDLIVMDPPRKGCDRCFLDAAIGMMPQKMIYISCHPGTLARDLKYLDQNGYQTVKIQPIDLFPFTHHVECVALIKRS